MERERAWGVCMRGLHLAGLGVVLIPSAQVPLARTQSHGPIQLQGRLAGKYQHIREKKKMSFGIHKYSALPQEASPFSEPGFSGLWKDSV